MLPAALVEKAADPGGTPKRLALTNLLNDMQKLSRLLVERSEAGDTLNAFLLAAGMAQIAEDHLHADPLHLHRAGSRLRRWSASRATSAAALLAHAAARVLARGRQLLPAQRRIAAWLPGLNALVMELAGELVDKPAPDAQTYAEAARAVDSRLRALPQDLRRELVRLPSCFRNFDLCLDDLASLATAFAAGRPNREMPLAVVGVRTSGSYLAPLLARQLARLGFRQVSVFTVRPGQRWLAGESRALRRLADAGGLAILCDDPPRTGAAVAASALELERQGFGSSSIVLLLHLFGTEAELPDALRRYPSLLLPWREWMVQRRLAPAEVSAAMERLLGGGSKISRLRRVDPDSSGTARGHAAALFQATLELPGRPAEILLLGVRGVGLGYFGDHSLAVAARLTGWVPEVFGLEDGLLYEALPGSSARLAEPLPQPLLGSLVAYVDARARALPVDEDLSVRLAYRGAIWHRAGQTLAGLFGRLADAGRPIGAAAAREVLKVERPSVIDGLAELSRFARSARSEGILKTDFDAGPFSSSDDHCFDPVYDLAQLSASLSDGDVADRLREAYEAISSEPVEPERWLLNSMVALAEERTGSRLEHLEREKRLSRAFQHYYARMLFAGLTPPAGGPLCALDVDGVLESAPLGFTMLSPSGALALRALLKHGFRALLTTGRSLPELVERCRAYCLPGGVAEYGAAVYEAGRGLSRTNLDAVQSDALDSLRSVLRRRPGVELDGEHKYSVRAFRLQPAPGRSGLAYDRVGLTAEEAAEAIGAAGVAGQVRPVPGKRQTDFVPAGLDKAFGLRLLLEEPSFAGAGIALAVGDTVEDLGVLAMAHVARAPGNADPAVRAAGVAVSRRACQRGLLDIVGELLGHAPGDCIQCAGPPLSPASRLLFELLAVDESRGLAKAARLAWLLRNRSVRRGIVL